MKKVYLFDIDENTGKGVFQISQVEEPAIEVNFVAFSSEVEEKMEFSIDEEKMQLAGPILISNKEMYRKELDGYIKFTDESLIKARDSFKMNNNNFSMNVEHSDKKAPSFVMEDWMVEPGVGDKSSKWGFSFDSLTWFGVIKITSKDYWDKFIKTGLVKGFSVEIDKASVKIKEDFNMEKPNENPEITNDIKLGKVELADGTVIYWEGDTIGVDTKIFVDEAMTQAIADGELTDGEGNTIVVKGGVVIEIRPKVEEEMSENSDQNSEEVKTEFLSKDEFNQIMSQLSSRIDALESKLTEKEKVNEELSKELEEVKKSKPGQPSFTFKKNVETKKVVEVSKPKYSEMLKQSYKEQGKL